MKPSLWFRRSIFELLERMVIAVAHIRCSRRLNQRATMVRW
jgi:hypothetical protein